MPNLETVGEILKRYPLCDSCLGRQFPSEMKDLDHASKGRELKRQAGTNDKPGEPCHICGGLLSNIDKYTKLVMNALKGYEFDSLIIGARIPLSITETEDHLRAETKLRGGETLKTNFTGELNRTVSQQFGVEVKHRMPDVTVIVDTLIDHVSVTPNPLYVYGRYVKTRRGIPQKRRRCRECRGEGCPECSLTGYATSDSVEQRLTEPLLTLFKAGRVKFTWIGGEDTNSLVSGSGRPFYAEVSAPMIRRPREIEPEIRKVDDAVALKELTILKGAPSGDRSFAVTVRSDLTLDQPGAEVAVKNLEASFTGVSVTMAPPEKRNSLTKRIHHLTVESVEDRHLRLRIECEGGLSIRRFLTGEGGEVKPNIADTLERKVVLDASAPFDILDVRFEAQ